MPCLVFFEHLFRNFDFGLAFASPKLWIESKLIADPREARLASEVVDSTDTERPFGASGGLVKRWVQRVVRQPTTTRCPRDSPHLRRCLDGAVKSPIAA
jgi:hypothetical protein